MTFNEHYHFYDELAEDIHEIAVRRGLMSELHYKHVVGKFVYSLALQHKMLHLCRDDLEHKLRRTCSARHRTISVFILGHKTLKPATLYTTCTLSSTPRNSLYYDADLRHLLNHSADRSCTSLMSAG